jgi:aerobic-type carbon monoxide dehydrogenase small subunit (CoxS/CutS family)
VPAVLRNENDARTKTLIVEICDGKMIVTLEDLLEHKSVTLTLLRARMPETQPIVQTMGSAGGFGFPGSIPVKSQFHSV